MIPTNSDIVSSTNRNVADEEGTPTSCRVYLRVRRRTNVSAVSSLRLEGIGDNYSRQNSVKKRSLVDEFRSINISPTNDDVNDDNDDDDGTSEPMLKRRPALWKLVTLAKLPPTSSNDGGTDSVPNDDFDNRHHKHGKKRIITASFEDDSDKTPINVCGAPGTIGDDSNNIKNKRRKLAIVDETTTDASLDTLWNDENAKTTTPKKKGIKILHPLERLVDDSLQDVFKGEQTVYQHIQFLSNDPNLNDNIGGDMGNSRKWMLWCNVEYGNVLHACSIWNDLTSANDILSYLSNLPKRNHDDDKNTKNANDRISIASTTRDSSGHTPYDVAKLSSHTGICTLLSSYGADRTGDSCDEDYYEYDLYYLQETENEGQSIVANDDCDNVSIDSAVVTCELRNGQTGYWNEDGELVLDLFTDTTEDPNSDDDDDDDSNRESWTGNDYPDEADSDNDNGIWNPSGDSDDDNPDTTYRNRRVSLSDSYGSNDGSDHGLYDASYGMYSGKPDLYDDDC